MDFGTRLKELRRGKGFTLRTLAEAAEINFTYLSKIENGKAGYLPAEDTIRAIAAALGVDALELLRLADKVPPELERLTENAQARRFLERAQQIASPDDWNALLDLLERRQQKRERKRKKGT